MSEPLVGAGLLLAAGAGSRMGQPKALVEDPVAGSWLHHSVRTLLAGGCGRVTVVVGARADEALRLLDAAYPRDGVQVRGIVAREWEQGMSASLRAGLTALSEEWYDAPASAPIAALVSLVDLPDLTLGVVDRVLAAGSAGGDGADGADVLARATYDGRPGHPVLIGRAHWPAVIADVAGDEGARGYLATRPVTTVECGDLASGQDQDTREPPQVHGG